MLGQRPAQVLRRDVAAAADSGGGPSQLPVRRRQRGQGSAERRAEARLAERLRREAAGEPIRRDAEPPRQDVEPERPKRELEPTNRQNGARPEPRGRPNEGSQRPDTRLVAVQQLMRIEEEGAYAGLVNGPSPDSVYEEDGEGDGMGSGRQRIARDLSDSAADLSPMQQRTLRSLVSGVTRWRRRLDYVLSTLSGRSPAELDAPVRQVLRLALYELIFMSLAPHALGEFVELSRRCEANEGAVRLVNGVLRAAARHRDAGTIPDPKSELEPGSTNPRDLLRCLAITHSHPTWMVKRWMDKWGPGATEALMQHNNRPPMYTVRVNSLQGQSLSPLASQLRDQGVDTQPCALAPDEFLEVRAGLQALLGNGHVSEGRCAVQDVSSGLVVRLALNPQPGERVLDCCAAPGGKALYAAARMQGKGSITAVDVSAARVRAMERMAARQGVPPSMMQTQAADMLVWAPAQAAKAQAQDLDLWDKVLLDAPCSGTGVLSKRADLRWRRSPDDLKQLLGLQARLLDAAALLVRPGGLLVYSTCSIEEEEDDHQVTAFLARNPDFEVQRIQDRDGLAHVISKEGYLRTLPMMHNTDGVFAARLVRKA